MSDINQINALLNQASELARRGNHGSALQCFDRVLASNPGTNLAQITLANKALLLANMGRTHDALACYELALEPGAMNQWLNLPGEFKARVLTKPVYEFAFNSKGTLLLKLGQGAGALECFDKAIQINPLYPLPHYNKANILHQQKRFSEALAAYDRCLELNPGIPAAWHNKGTVLKDLGRNQEALSCFDNAIKLDAQGVNPWIGKATTFLNLKNAPEALKCCDHALALKPDHEIALTLKGNALIKLGKNPEALACLNRAVAVNPKSAYGWYNKALALQRMSDFPEAAACFEKAHQLGHPQAAQGMALARNGQTGAPPSSPLAAHPSGATKAPDTSSSRPKPEDSAPGPAGREAADNVKVAVLMGNVPDQRDSMHWLCYAIVRSKYVTEHPDLYAGQTGVVIPTFEEELTGRSSMAVSCAELVQRGDPPGSAYFSDLLKVHQKGFLREYVWHFLGQPSWPEKDRPAQLPSFIGWAGINLKKHVVETYNGVSIQRGGQGTVDVRPPPAEVKNVAGPGLEQQAAGAGADFQKGDHSGALQKLDEIIRAARALQTGPGVIYLSIRDRAEMSFYLRGHPEVRSVSVLPWYLAGALFAKGFILAHQKRYQESLGCLEELIHLAPLSAQAHREKGFVLGQLGRPKEALAAFSVAWDLAGRLPVNAGEAGASLRGMGASLIELGELDRAEKLLLASLNINPDSQENVLAQRELAYITHIRLGGRPSSVETFTTKSQPG